MVLLAHRIGTKAADSRQVIMILVVVVLGLRTMASRKLNGHYSDFSLYQIYGSTVPVPIKASSFAMFTVHRFTRLHPYPP